MFLLIFEENYFKICNFYLFLLNLSWSRYESGCAKSDECKSQG